MLNGYKKLVSAAIEARKNSYSPYSKLKVGAAVLTKKGKIYTGANIENSSYGLSICAERVAIASAAAHGNTTIKAVAVVYGNQYAIVCGACLQFISEFGNDIDIIMANMKGKYLVNKIYELLPLAFCLNRKGSK